MGSVFGGGGSKSSSTSTNKTNVTVNVSNDVDTSGVQAAFEEFSETQAELTREVSKEWLSAASELVEGLKPSLEALEKREKIQVAAVGIGAAALLYMAASKGK